VSVPAVIRAVAATVLVLLCHAPTVRADIVDAGPGGFTVKTSIDIAAIPKAAYIAFVVWIGSWWDAQHTWSGDAKNLSIDARVGGCFCERLPAGGAVQHMSIVWLQPEKVVRMVGGLGPLQELAVSGTMTWEFKPTAGATRVDMTYAVSGYAKDGLVPLAKTVDALLADQVSRLKRFVEIGMPK
jgi:hypothetical protein